MHGALRLEGSAPKCEYSYRLSDKPEWEILGKRMSDDGVSRQDENGGSK